VKGSDLFSNILYHSSVKQHGDILIDAVQNLQSCVSTSEALGKFYGLKDKDKKKRQKKREIGVELFYTFLG
jgi:hypothetical protein